MRRTSTVIAAAVVAAALTLNCSPPESETGEQARGEGADAPAPTLGVIGDADIATPERGSWPSYGRDYAEQRFSPLAQINRDTIGQLGLAFSVDTQTRFAQEATPLMVDNTLIFPIDWNIVVALDATTGEETWRFDPGSSARGQMQTGAGVISRGVALYAGKVYIATWGGYLVAVDAGTGEEVWRVDTIVDRSVTYWISGAPRAAKGKIFIGNGGSEMGTRGYVTAYDAETGEQVWRFFMVPGDPSLPFEHPELEIAATTWGGEWWKFGGGGNVWNSIVYDAEFDQVYLGGGNAAPWSRQTRDPSGGDNLFVAAIVAVDADTGRMNWYYQTTPGDNWDFTAVQDIVLADMEVDGAPRKVLLQAPKNGFFYVIDRADGTLLRAHPFVTTTWATHVDMETGRPVENEALHYDKEAKWILPGPLGGHNWHAMAFDPTRGIAYFPAHDAPFPFALPDTFMETGIYKPGKYIPHYGVEMGRLAELANLPGEPETKGYLKAFNPLTGEELWVVELGHFWNGGALATAGGLIFQGNAAGTLDAYDSDTGERLWSFDAYTSIIAPPITYEIDGVQYVAILTGTGGVWVYDFSDEWFEGRSASYKYGNAGELLVFKLGGTATLAKPALLDKTIPEPPALEASAEAVKRGEHLYHEYCGDCHGREARSSGIQPDLRMMNAATHEIFEDIVIDGVYQAKGMESFGDLISREDAQQIRAYVVSRAKAARAEQEGAVGSD